MLTQSAFGKIKYISKSLETVRFKAFYNNVHREAGLYGIPELWKYYWMRKLAM